MDAIRVVPQTRWLTAAAQAAVAFLGEVRSAESQQAKVSFAICSAVEFVFDRQSVHVCPERAWLKALATP